VAARYLSVTYCTSLAGHDFVVAAFNQTATTLSSVSAAFWVTVEAASAVAATHVRRMGYTVPASTTDAGDLKALTYAIWYEMMHNRPENRIPLPETWGSDPMKLLFEEVKAGEAHMSLASSAGYAVGGCTWSESSTSVSPADGSRSTIFTRDRW
jgi:hypothetical protein